MTEGFGDNLQFARYAKMAHERVGRVVLESYDELYGLMERVEGYDQLVRREHANRPPEGLELDLHLKLYDLPRVFRTTIETIPTETPYLFASEERVEKWKARLAEEKRFKVGLVWGGRPTFSNDRNRSMSLKDFAPLGDVENVAFYSLQKGERAVEAKSPPDGLQITDLSDELNDFDDTAAVLNELDLLISVDTSPVHLAGGLGRPVWTLLAFLNDWRWGVDSETTPWYPTMRLFRQKRMGDWTDVMERVREELSPFGGGAKGELIR